MTQPQHKPSAPTTSKMEILRYILIFFGALIMAACAVGAGLTIARSDTPVGVSLAIAVIILATGATAGMILFALAGLLSLLEERIRQSRLQQRSLDSLQSAITALHQAFRQQVPPTVIQSSQPTVGSIPTDHPQPQTQIAALTHELRDLLLMDDRQKQEAARHHWTGRKHSMMHEIERYMHLGEWNAAHATVDDLHAMLPGDPDIAQLKDRITSEQNARLEGDVAAAQNQLRHAMSISAWEQAEEVVAGLRKKYPTAPEVQELAETLAREHEAFDREHTDRLFLDLASASEHRDWRRALQIGEEILRRFPTDSRVERLEFDMATIRDNAAALERKEQEALFKDLLKRQRYDEAIQVANAVIAKYPESPASVELQKLLPKVQELHRAQRLEREKISGPAI